MTLTEALPWIMLFSVVVMLWICLRIFAETCQMFIEISKLNNERVELLNELMAAIGKQIPTPQLPDGNGQA